MLEQKRVWPNPMVVKECHVSTGRSRFLYSRMLATYISNVLIKIFYIIKIYKKLYHNERLCKCYFMLNLL